VEIFFFDFNHSKRITMEKKLIFINKLFMKFKNSRNSCQKTNTLGAAVKLPSPTKFQTLPRQLRQMATGVTGSIYV
jgi:hypothetical protein